MAEPPAKIVDFYERVRSLSMRDVAKLPGYIDLEANERLVKHPQLFVAPERGMKMQDDYFRIQGVFFDFAGRCAMPGCPQQNKHIHSIQAPGVREVRGFPGLSIYPTYFLPVLPELLQMVLDLQGIELGDNSPKLSQPGHEGVKGKHVVLPPELRTLIQKTYPMMVNPDRATVYIPTSQHPPGLRQPQTENDVALHLFLGCDAIFIVGNEAAVDDQKSDTAHRDVVVDDDDWKNFVKFDSDGEDREENLQSSIKIDHEKNDKEDSIPGNPPPEPNVGAFRLRAGDVLLFDDQTINSWVGVAKVLEGSSCLWQQWPHLRKDTRDSDPAAIRGQLNGRTIEVEIR